nr:MFS transporter [Amycolatopsis taiwanensis]
MGTGGQRHRAETAAFGVYQIIIAQTLGEAARTKALAARRSTLNLGFSVAAGLTAVVVGIGTPVAYLAAFLFSGGLLLASAWFIHALPSGPADRPDTEEPEVKVSPRSVLHDPRYLTLILVASFFATSLSLLTVGVPLWVVAHTHAPHAIVGLLMGTNTVLVMIFQVRLASRAETLKGARRAVAFGGFGFAIAAAVYAVAGRSPTLVTGPCASHALRVIPARDAYAQACAVLDPVLEDRPLTADIAAGVELLDSLSRI